MPTVASLLRELTISGLDVKAPTKLLLEELWDNLFAKDGNEIFVDAFFEAVVEEARGEEAGWTKAELRRILDLEAKNITFENLDNHSLANEIQVLLRTNNVALIPSRVADHYDFENTLSNVINRALIIFDKKLHSRENSQLRERLLEKYVRETGRSQAEISRDLLVVTDRVDSLERNMVYINTKMNEAQLLLQNIDLALARIQSLDKTNNYSLIQREDLDSYHRELTSYRETARLISEHWSEYVSPRDIPLQERKDVLTIQKRILEISRQIGLKVADINNN